MRIIFIFSWFSRLFNNYYWGLSFPLSWFRGVSNLPVLIGSYYNYKVYSIVNREFVSLLFTILGFLYVAFLGFLPLRSLLFVYLWGNSLLFLTFYYFYLFPLEGAFWLLVLASWDLYQSWAYLCFKAEALFDFFEFWWNYYYYGFKRFRFCLYFRGFLAALKELLEWFGFEPIPKGWLIELIKSFFE